MVQLESRYGPNLKRLGAYLLTMSHKALSQIRQDRSGSLDLYPVNPAGQGGNGISGFFVDDISYTHLPATLPPGLNGGVSFHFNQNSVELQDLSYDVVATARNLGESRNQFF